jgi:hypothetical protein
MPDVSKSTRGSAKDEGAMGTQIASV